MWTENCYKDKLYNKFNNLYFFEYVQQFSSIWNKLFISETCYKYKSFINLTVEMSNQKATLRFLIGLLWVVIQSS